MILKNELLEISRHDIVKIALKHTLEDPDLVGDIKYVEGIYNILAENILYLLDRRDGE